MKLIGTNFWRGTVFRKWQKLLVMGVTAAALCACGGGGGSAAPAPVTHIVGGTVTGLAGTLVLQNNGGDDLTLSADGSFSFSKAVSNGHLYAVSVLTQPSSVECAVSSGRSWSTVNVTTVSVQCAAPKGTRLLGVAGVDTRGRGVATDGAGNVYVTGDTYGDLDGNTRTSGSNVFVTKYNSNGVKQYTRQLEAAGGDTWGNSVTTDASGNVYVVGGTKGRLDGNRQTGYFDFFVTKYNTNGVKQYTRQFGAVDTETVGRLVATDASGNVYVAGDINYAMGASVGLDGNPKIGKTFEFFVTKYDSSGVKQYTRQLGAVGPGGFLVGAAVAGASVATDASGNVYVAGSTNGGLDGNTLTGGVDCFLTKYDINGVKQYTRQLGVAGADTGCVSVGTTASGNVYVVGLTTGGLDGNVLTGTQNFFVTTYDSKGVKQYTRQYPSPGTLPNGSVFTNGRDFYVVGSTTVGLDGNTQTGAKDFFVTKYSGYDGTRQYTRQLGVAGGLTLGYSVATGSSGNVYVAGWTTGGLDGNTLTGTTDAFVTKYNSSGVKQ